MQHTAQRLTTRLFSAKQAVLLTQTRHLSLTHVSQEGMPCMVDVAGKAESQRIATARSTVLLPPIIVKELRLDQGKEGSLKSGVMTDIIATNDIITKKGPVFATAIIAGTQAVKQTSNLIPFCHPLPIEDCKFKLSYELDDSRCSDPSSEPWAKVHVECQVKVTHKTGVEMEALTGVSVAALTIYDMCKALSHSIVIYNTQLVQKSGGKSDFRLNENTKQDQS